MDDVEVQAIHYSIAEEKHQLIAVATKTLKYMPKITSDKFVAIPDKDRRYLEASLEKAANLIAVSEHTGRSISSPEPPVAFLAENKIECEWLASTRGMLFTEGHKVRNEREISTGTRFVVDLNKHLDLLKDRPDGVALVAEALTQSHSVGKYHEFIRLFERAFRASPRLIAEPLASYLSTSIFGYDYDEVKRWLNIRDAVTHADQRNLFLLERDVRPYIFRMEQAAYDVLLNKAEWREPSDTRRKGWTPASGTTSSKGNPCVTRGEGATLIFQMLDDFGIYPTNLNAGLHNLLPDDWWFRRPPKRWCPNECSQDLWAEPRDETGG